MEAWALVGALALVLANAFFVAIDRASILETVRTGASGIGRGERILRV